MQNRNCIMRKEIVGDLRSLEGLTHLSRIIHFVRMTRVLFCLIREGGRRQTKPELTVWLVQIVLL